MNKHMRIEKFPISFIDLTILARSSLNEVHDLASLNILNILKDLKADMAPPVKETPAHYMPFSTVDNITTRQSNRLNVSFI